MKLTAELQRRQDGWQTNNGPNGQKDIARTEIVTAHNQATRAYIQWAIEHGYMQNVYRRWVTSNNDNVCPICVALNGQTVPFDKPYNVPSDIKYNGPEIMAPPVHTNCCCGEEFSRVTIIKYRVFQTNGTV